MARGKGKKQSPKETKNQEQIKQDKRIKNDKDGISSNLQEAKQIISNYKDDIKSLEQVDQEKEDQIQQIQDIIETIKVKIDNLKKEKQEQDSDNLLKSGDVNEDQFMEIFKQHLKTDKVRDNSYDDIYKNRTTKDKKIIYTSPLLPKNSRILHEMDYTYTSFCDSWGFTRIIFENEDGTQLILQNFEITDNKLDKSITKENYNNEYIHIKNMHQFIKEGLNITAESQKNINIEKLFEHITTFLFILQDTHFESELEDLFEE